MHKFVWFLQQYCRVNTQDGWVLTQMLTPACIPSDIYFSLPTPPPPFFSPQAANISVGFYIKASVMFSKWTLLKQKNKKAFSVNRLPTSKPLALIV